MKDRGVEEWRPILASRGQYEASSEGRIRNARTGRILKQYETNGRMLMKLNGFMRGKNYSVAQLVYVAFHPGPVDYRVFHRNRISTDNRIGNLYKIQRETDGKGKS